MVFRKWQEEVCSEMQRNKQQQQRLGVEIPGPTSTSWRRGGGGECGAKGVDQREVWVVKGRSLGLMCSTKGIYCRFLSNRER